jgi:succinate dehydrogenase / fumarate reductase membrane anchor subunit
MALPHDYRSGRPIPTHNPFELYAWFFMRVSGVVLLLLALGHLVIMHLINNIEEINYAFVAQRWATPFWRCYDGLMLFLALLHGMNGLRTILDDYLKPGALRVFCMSLLYLTTTLFFILGFMIIFTFQAR